jgi:nitroreductase
LVFQKIASSPCFHDWHYIKIRTLECALEGFDPEKFDEILGLEARGFASVVVCAFGYRSPEDKHALEAKVRFSREDLLEHR